MSEDLKDFMENRVDFGTKPLEYPLTDDQKKLAAFAMALNASIVQFINEGLFPESQQMHFMGHLQDFMARLHAGEGVKMPNTSQTLQVNSKAGTLFFEASNDAFANGSKNWQEIQQEVRTKLAEVNSDMSPKRILN